MALLARSGFLHVRWFPTVEILRFRRINVQKPRPPHYERALYLALLSPKFKEDESVYLPPSATCKKKAELIQYKTKIDNPLENMIAKEVFEKFQSSKVIGFLHLNPINEEDKFQARVLLNRIGFSYEVHSKSTLKIALCGTIYEAVLPLFMAFTSIVFSSEDKVKPLLKVLKKIPQFVLMAGIVEGRFLNINQLIAYSEIENITAARVKLLSVLNSSQCQLIKYLNTPASHLNEQLKFIGSAKNSKQ